MSDGVAVHMLLDGFGAAATPDAHAASLRRAGCELAFYSPAGSLITGRANHRNHRRALVMDRRIAFTGGSGIADKWLGDGREEGHWRDTDVRIEGPAVRQLQSATALAVRVRRALNGTLPADCVARPTLGAP